MKHRWNSLPIVYKLFVTLFGGIAVIIITLLSYLWGYESELMLTKEQDLLHHQSTHIADELTTHLVNLQKEILFLSRLEVMNDMVTQDMDRRITSILEQKAGDLGESITLYTIASDFSVIASSQASLINTTFPEKDMIITAIKKGENNLFFGENLYFLTPIYGSFYTKDFLGYLVMSYPFKNFAIQLKADQSFYRWLTPPSSTPPIHYQGNNPIFDTEAYLHDNITLTEILKGWTLHYAMPKNEALALLYHFQTLLLSLFAVGLTLIAFLVWIIVLRIIKPLRELSDTAMKISSTGDYSQTVVATGFDEIGIMAHSFNALMFTTMVNIKRLELLGKTQAALQAKSSFLSAMSHELRTPLGSILSLTQYLITQPNTPNPVCETLEKIENSAHHLLGVINNILDLAKVESGKMVPHLALCDPVTLIKNALDLVSPLAEDKELLIRTEFEPFEGDFISDPRLFGQVIINLLSNAIKFTEHGFIDVQLHYYEDLFIVQIKDTGRGIKEEALADLFDDFYQVRTKDQNTLEGSGLGLAISKRIALLLQGDLYLRSEGEGKGTIALFHFRSCKN
ncbi:MAG: HAMP domain-containing sensor histidine kinase [Campylobacterales bacterium]|nr:HAMP domain-containing sensor histidine kinase [Campylobacterales bacterium]